MVCPDESNFKAKCYLCHGKGFVNILVEDFE
jgi:hypothetical protein